MTILDQSGDTAFRELHRYARLYQFPEFAKKAELRDIVGPDQPKANHFADVRMPHQFPCHTKAATFVSTVYFLEKQASIHPKVRPMIEARLAKFAEYWGIKNAVTELRSKHAALNKESDLPDSSYAIVWAGEDGRKDRRYPLRNGLEVKAAATWFYDRNDSLRKEYGFIDRQTIATKILDKAAEFGVDIAKYRETLEKAAGMGFYDPTELAKAIRDRVKAASHVSPELALGMNKLAEKIESQPRSFIDPDSATKLAATLDQFDRNHRLVGRYTEMIPSPEDLVFKATRSKLAEVCKESCTTHTGSVYDVNDFAKLSATDVRDLFGDEIADAVTTGLKVDADKMAEVVATFPRPDAVLFDQLMQDKGFTPIAKEASATRVGFSHSQLKSMAVA